MTGEDSARSADSQACGKLGIRSAVRIRRKSALMRAMVALIPAGQRAFRTRNIILNPEVQCWSGQCIPGLVPALQLPSGSYLSRLIWVHFNSVLWTGTFRSIAGIPLTGSWRTIVNFGECSLNEEGVDVRDYRGARLGPAICQPNGPGTLPINFGVAPAHGNCNRQCQHQKL
jgi:hypothetical protein